MLKKISVILLVYVMMISSALVNVKALSYNGFTYELNDNQATIISYESNQSDIDTLKIPDTIDGYKVTKINGQFHANLSNSRDEYSSVNTLVLPSSLEDITLPDDRREALFCEIKSLKFENTNTNFFTDNGCVYNKDKSILYFIPNGLKELNIPSTTKKANLGNLVDTQLTQLTIPSNVEFIYLDWVDWSYGLQLPHTLNTLNMNATCDFKLVANSLTKLTFGTNVTDLSECSIICNNMSELNLPNGLVKMPSWIQSQKLKVLNIPSEVNEFYTSIYADNLEAFVVDQNNKTLKSVDGALFSNNKLLRYPKALKKETYEVPEGTTSVIEVGNQYLKNLKLPNSLVQIDSSAMQEAINLETLNIPQNMNVPSDDEQHPDLDILLSNCNKIKNLTLGTNNKYYTISNGALYSKDYKVLYKYLDYNEKNPVINDNTTKIGWSAFDGKRSITNIDVKNVTDIVYGAFNDCTSLNDIKLRSIQYLGSYAFRNCTSLKNVQLPETLNDKKWEIFSGCTNLESVYIPAKVDYVEDDFLNCYKLVNITVSKDNENYVVSDNALYTKDLKKLVLQLDKNITSFTAKSATETIGMQAFLNCTKLKNVDLNNVKQIDASMFDGCSSMNYFVVPKTVEEVYNRGYSNNSCKLYVYPNSKALKCIESWNGYDYDEKINYQIITSYEDINTKIEINVIPNLPMNNVTLKTSRVTQGDSYNAVAQYSDKFDLYDVSFYKDNQKVNFDGKAVVRIPVKEGLDGTKCKVYYNNNGQFTDMNAVYKDGYMEFETTHFSEYVVVEGTLPTTAMGDVNEDGKVDFLDAIMVLRYDAEIIQLTDNQMRAAEVNKDGKVDFLDAIMILRYDAEIIDSLN